MASHDVVGWLRASQRICRHVMQASTARLCVCKPPATQQAPTVVAPTFARLRVRVHDATSKAGTPCCSHLCLQVFDESGLASQRLPCLPQRRLCRLPLSCLLLQLLLSFLQLLPSFL